MIAAWICIDGEEPINVFFVAVPPIGGRIGFPDGTSVFVRDVLFNVRVGRQGLPDEAEVVSITAERPVPPPASPSPGPLFEKEKQP